LTAASTSTPFQLADCGDLRLAHHLTAATVTRSSRLNGPSLRAAVTAAPGSATVRSLDVQLPPSLPARQGTLRHVCAAAEFTSNPATCPLASQVGAASAPTPLLGHPLKATAYLVSHGSEVFPD
jgi:hypothetical protein